MLYAQAGQSHLACTTETSLELNPGSLSPVCSLSARPHDLADLIDSGTARGGVRATARPLISILQARGGGAIPGFALSRPIDRFVRVLTPPAVELPPLWLCALRVRASIQLEIRQQALKNSVPSLSLRVLCRLCSLHSDEI